MAAKNFRHDLIRGPVRMKAGDELDIIREGQVINLVRPGPGHVYASKGAAVEVRDPRKVFVVDAKLGAAFVLKARLRIERPNDAWLAFPAVRHPGDSARGGTFTPEELVGTRAPGSCC